MQTAARGAIIMNVLKCWKIMSMPEQDTMTVLQPVYD